MEAILAELAFLGVYRAELAWGFSLFLVSLLASLAAVAIVLVRMPEDYLNSPEDAPFWPGRPAWVRVAAKIGKNLAGVLLIAIGVVLSVPGIPGQGVLTILIGVVLLDLPGKRRFERRILSAPKVFAVVNRVRARFGRRPLRRHAAHGVSARDDG